uniref:PEP-CTERM protein-sorting domain-containing protein n=1 Tax=Solibacter usitatus (strain Ellin6076) TaxID=234267 RepID=Q023U7_SOLUE
MISAGANPGGLTFNGGGSFVTPIPSTARNDFTSVKNQLAAISSYTVETDLSTISGPGNYSFATQSAIKSMTISIPGTYIFKYTGAANLSNVNVNITLGPGVSSQDVIWYFPVSASFNNSNFAGEIVDLGSVTYTGNNTAPSFSITDNGGIYAAGAVSLNGINGDALHFTTQTAVSATPEPATLGMPPIGLLLGAISVRRRKHS